MSKTRVVGVVTRRYLDGGKCAVTLDRVTVLKGAKIPLPSGPMGRVVSINANRTVYAVRGNRKSCTHSGKGSTRALRPNVYSMTKDNV